MVGEVYLLSTEAVATYYGARGRAPPGLQLPAAVRPVAGAASGPSASSGPWPGPGARGTPGPPGCSPTTTTPGTGPATTAPRGPRARPRTTTERRSEARARAAAVLLLTLRGTPFLFQGEELGLARRRRSRRTAGRPGRARRVPGADPLGRDRRPRVAHRRRRRPWLPFSAELATRNYAAQRADPNSILHLYRRLIALRRRHPALALGDFASARGPRRRPGLPAGARRRRLHGDDQFHRRRSGRRRPSRLSGHWATRPGARVALSSDGCAEGSRFDGRLLPDQALVLLG